VIARPSAPVRDWNRTFLALVLVLVASGCRPGGQLSGARPHTNAAPPTLPGAAPVQTETGPAPTPPGAITAPPATPPSEVEAAVAQQPRDFDLRMKAAQYYMTGGQSAAAIPHLEAATRLRTDVPLAWIALGDARMLAGQNTSARVAYERAQRLAPGDPLIDRGLGQILIRERRLEAARFLFSRAVYRHPENIELRLALGNLYLVLRRPALAVQVLKPAAAAASGSADVHYLLGQAYEADLHIQAALNEQRAAVAAEPTFAEAYGRIGIYLIDLTRYAEARPPLQQAIQLNPRESHYYWALGDSYLFDVADPGNLGRAIQLYHQALGIEPRNDKAQMSLALALTRRGGPGDLEEAAGILQRRTRQAPEDANAFYKLYEVQSRLGHAATARQALSRFQSLESRGRSQTARRYQMVSFVDTASAHLRLGRRYLAERRNGMAATEFRLALERDPHLEEARAELARTRRGPGMSGPYR
jgi:predicted Zn-dependent protease